MEHLKAFCCTPVICEETGYYGGDLSVLAYARSEAAARAKCFDVLKSRIRMGLVERKPYRTDDAA